MELPARPSARAASSRHPWVWSALYFPYGLTFGFPTIALGYLASRAGIPVSAIAGVIGMTFLAAGWKFLWAPIADYTLTRKRWYVIAVAAVSAGFVGMTRVPLTPRFMPLLALLVFATSLAGTFIAFATEGLMTHNTPSGGRGRAGGWFQSGNQFGQTAGGGLGLWLMKHMPSPWLAGAALAAILWVCALALRGLEEPPRPLHGATVRERVADAWRELSSVLGSRAGRIGLVLAILPMGTGAAQALFGSLGPEWHVPANTVSGVLGLGGGLAIVAGCFAGGRLADRMSRPGSYALACGLGVVACVAIAYAPRTAAGYAATTLFYTFTLGMAAATLTALVLAIIGDTAAATKINVFFALNTLFSLGMLRVCGWAHDAWATTGMLLTEAAAGAASLIAFAVLVKRVRGSVPGTTVPA